MWRVVNTIYSDDGRWVWDGAQWQPTPDPEREVATSRPLTATDFTDRASSARLLAGLTLVLILLAGGAGTAWVMTRDADTPDRAAQAWVEAVFDGDAIKACGLTDLETRAQAPAACEETLTGLRRSTRRIRRQRPAELAQATTRTVELAGSTATVAVDGPEEPWLQLEMSKTEDGWKVAAFTSPQR